MDLRRLPVDCHCSFGLDVFVLSHRLDFDAMVWSVVNFARVSDKGPVSANFRHSIYHCYKAKQAPDTVVVEIIIAAVVEVIAKASPILNSFGPSFNTMVDVLAFCNPPDSDQTSTFHAARYPA